MHIHFSKIALSVIASGFSVQSLAQSSDAPEKLSITSYRPYNGFAGCTTQAIHPEVTPARDAVTFRFDDYSVELGRRLTHCSLALRLAYTPRWSFAIEQVAFEGRARFPAGGLGGEVRFHYYVSGGEEYRSLPHFIKGPVDGAFSGVENETRPLQWSACDGASSVNMLTSLISGERSVNGPILSLSDIVGEGDPKLQLRLRWRRCD